MEYKTNAPKGADLLASEKPGWFRDFDIRTFRIYDIWNCVLGKTYGQYGLGLDALFPEADRPAHDPFGFEASRLHGFNSIDGNGDRLQLEWIHIITDLQAGDVPGGSEEEMRGE